MTDTNKKVDQSDLVHKTEDGRYYQELLDILYPNQEVILQNFEFRLPNTVILTVYKPEKLTSVSISISETKLDDTLNRLLNV